MSRDQCDAGSFVADAAHLRSILDEAEVLIYSKDLAGRYVWANRRALEVSGRAMEDVLGKTDRELLPLELAERFRLIDEQLTSGQTDRLTVESTLTMADGSVRSFENISKPLKDSDGRTIGVFGTSADITVRKELERELKQQGKLLQTILDHADASIYMIDGDHRFHYVNKACAQLLQRPGEEIVGKLDLEFLDTDTAMRLRVLNERVFQTGQPQRGEDEYIDPAGVKRVFWTVKAPLHSADGEPPMLIGISTDITAIHQAQERLRDLSLTDPLTGLSNRRDFDEHLGRELKRAEREGCSTALLVMDLDFFKAVNDQYGHPTGDDVLVTVARLIRESTRAGDVAARLGGEEFGVLMPATDRTEALNAAERLRQRLAGTIHQAQDHSTFRLTISIGVAVCQAGNQSTLELYSAADQLLLEAKRQGRNRVIG